jgi:hypothetical protein
MASKRDAMRGAMRGAMRIFVTGNYLNPTLDGCALTEGNKPRQSTKL